MEFTEEQIKELGLTDNVSNVSSFFDEQIANVKKEFDGIANTNAEKILDGAISKVVSDTNIQRQQGEKVGDYINRAWVESNTEKLNELTKSKNDYEEKIKNFKGNDDLITKISKLEKDNDDLLQKYANYDDILEKSKSYDPLLEKYNETKKEVAFNSIKPNFPKEVNVYEANAKWTEFKNNILKDYNLELVDGKALAISKENKHKQVNLSELVERDETLKSLLQGRQQQGTGGQDPTKITIKGVPFDVPEDSKNDSAKRTILIRDYLASKGITITSDAYSKRFAEYNSLIRNGQQKNA